MIAGGKKNKEEGSKAQITNQPAVQPAKAQQQGEKIELSKAGEVKEKRKNKKCEC